MVKKAGVLGLDVDDSDDTAFDDERDGELGADVGVGLDVVVDVVAGGAYVVDEDGFAVEGGLTDDAAAELDAHALDLVGVAVWKRIQSSLVRSLRRRMAKMR